MRRAFSHAEIDRRNAADDRKIAAQLRRDGRLLRVARNNLRRWMRRDGNKAHSAFQEWHQILTVLTRNEIADFLVSDTPMCRRLRQSSPFMGMLFKKSASKRSRHYKARTCMELFDVIVSKLAAGGLKDLEFVGALFKLRLADPKIIRRRIQRCQSVNERTRLRARLRAVLDDLAA